MGLQGREGGGMEGRRGKFMIYDGELGVFCVGIAWSFVREWKYTWLYERVSQSDNLHDKGEIST